MQKNKLYREAKSDISPRIKRRYHKTGKQKCKIEQRQYFYTVHDYLGEFATGKTCSQELSWTQRSVLTLQSAVY